MGIYKSILNISFQLISLFGIPIFYIPIIVYLTKVNFNFAIRLFYILLFTEIICGTIKIIYQKHRPIPMQNKTLFQKYYAGSFPSIHTARISALSIGLSLFYTNNLLRFILALLVIGVGYSRIYLMKHYFTDVFGGFTIGAIISIIGLVV